jgi:oligosaccharide repeat unit polymerase
MILLVCLILLFFFFNFRKPLSPALVLMGIYGGSVICGLLLIQEFGFRSPFDALNVVFMAVMISLFILPWNQFKYKTTTILEPDLEKVRKLTYLLLAVNGVIFLLFVLICYTAFGEVTDFSAFKNGGESAGFIDQLPIDSSLNHTLYLLASYLHSSAYFLIPLHFYYLQKERYRISIACLLFSTNLVLFGLTNFSRSAFVIYGVAYVLNFPFFYKTFNRKARRILLATMGCLLLCALIPFVQITANRFANEVSYNQAITDQTLISGPEVYSLFDYGGQWYRNASEVMSTYSFETLNGEISSSFILTIADKLGLINYPPEQMERTLYSIWGNRFDRFNGLIANLLFDFGYIGTAVFVLCYIGLMRMLRPVRSELSFANLLMLGPLFILPATGIFNSELKTMSYDTLIIYSLMILLYLKGRPNSVRARASLPARLAYNS